MIYVLVPYTNLQTETCFLHFSYLFLHSRYTRGLHNFCSVYIYIVVVCLLHHHHHHHIVATISIVITSPSVMYIYATFICKVISCTLHLLRVCEESSLAMNVFFAHSSSRLSSCIVHAPACPDMSVVSPASRSAHACCIIMRSRAHLKDEQEHVHNKRQA